MPRKDFLKLFPDNLTKVKWIDSLQKEKMFLGLLESLHNKDADVLLGIKNKDLNKTYKGLTENLVKEAFNWSDKFTKNN